MTARTEEGSAGPFWVQSAMKPLGQDKVADVADVVESLYGQLGEEGFEAIDAWLARIDADKADTVKLLAILRALFRSRSKLPAWQPLVGRALGAFDARGLQGRRILAGLFEA